MVLERAMFAFLTELLLIVRSRLRSQARLQAEILVLRQQVLILGRKAPSRARLRNLDRVIWSGCTESSQRFLARSPWSSRRRSSAGTGAVSEPTGTGSLAGAVDGRRSNARSEP